MPLPAADTVPGALTRYRDAIEAALRAAIPPGDGGLPAAARYVMGWEDESGRPAAAGGKRIRPALCVFGGSIFDGTLPEVLPGAVAVELVHNFSLVHDDVQDRDRERHGRPTTWVLHGEGQAINVGDYLYMCAIRALAAGPGPVERRLAALDVLNQAIGQMIEGQWADLGFETRDDVTVEEYLEMSARKTGALLGAPLEMGALLAGARAEEAAALGRWGQRVGLAFQASDDYLGIWGDPDETGKSNASDLVRRKKSLAVVHGMTRPEAASVLGKAFHAEGDISDTGPLVAALEAAGTDRFCLEEATRHADAADSILGELELPAAAVRDLREIATYLVNRRA